MIKLRLTIRIFLKEAPKNQNDSQDKNIPPSISDNDMSVSWEKPNNNNVFSKN